jgi:hypothetical protein
MAMTGKTATRTIAFGALAAAALALSTGGALADKHFTGTWKVKDTMRKPFEIILIEDGTAKANRNGEPLKGTWKEDGEAAMIVWEGGWKTKIAKDGAGYKKTAYEGGAEKGTTPAEKVK